MPRASCLGLGLLLVAAPAVARAQSEAGGAADLAKQLQNPVARAVDYGILANHIWSFAGDDDRVEVSQTFLQPFLSFLFPRGKKP